MAIIETVRGANFFGLGRGVFLGIDSMVGHYLTGYDEQRIGREYLGGSDAEIIGDRQVGTGYITTEGYYPAGNAFYLQTDLLETSDMTYLAACRTMDTLDTGETRPAILGCETNVDGSGLSFSGPVTFNAKASVYENGTPEVVSAYMTVPDPSDWAFYSARIEEGVGITVNDLTNGLSYFRAESRSRALSTSPLRIGSSYSGSNRYGQADIAYAGVATAALSDDDLALVYSRVRAALERKGITI